MRFFKEIFICFITLISILFILATPVIILKGDKEITISLNTEYKEPGYIAYYFIKDKTELVKVSNNIDNTKVGDYKVTYKLKYKKRTTKKTRIVHVVDDEKPTITLNGTGSYCPGSEYVEEGYSATDNYDGDITDKVVKEIKNNKVIYKVSDSSGNESKKTRKIKEQDIEEPKIALQGDTTINIYVGENYNEPGYIITDNCDKEIESKISITGDIDNTKAGDYVLTYSVTDFSGNTTSVERTVRVIKKETPVIDGTGKTIYLTFDDGPSASITPSLLKILKEEGVKATFFVINHDDSLNYLIKQEYDEGHKIALHSYTHNYSYVYSSIDNYFNDLNSIREKVHNITGEYTNIIRFPGGSSNTVSRAYYSGIMSILTKQVEEKGFYYFDWNVSSGDAGGSDNAAEVYDSVVNNLIYKNNVVLMHDFEGNYKTLNAIRDIIRFGKQNGYTFKTIDESTYGAHHRVNN
jgi:peptidoglycan/xylan/chitin deacetylase (PgdA/CDA1 family)